MSELNNLAREDHLPIVDRLLAVQTDLKSPKGQYNSFGKYKYRSCEDILEALKPLLAKYGLTLTISDDVVLIGERYYIKATAEVRDRDGETISNCAYARESLDKKGMDESQITGTASSYARKYALNGLFLIDDTKDADTDEYANQNTPRYADKKKEGLAWIDREKVKSLKADISAGIISEEALLNHFKTDKIEHITDAQYESYEKQKAKR